MAGRALFASLIVASIAGTVVVCGCSERDVEPGAFIEDGIPAAEKEPDFVTAAAKEFFRGWLEEHGNTDIVEDKRGIGIKGSGTRLAAFHYGSDESDHGFTVETEFRITLPDGREIVEFVAGGGDTQEAAVRMTFLNFTLSTFHVVYSCFMNSDDPHLTHERINIGGSEWIMTTGGMFALGGDNLPGFSEVSKAFRDELSDLKLRDRAHWIKLVYGRHQDEVVAATVTLDNETHLSLTSEIESLPWPATEEFYMAKQFIVLRPAAATQDSAN